MKWSYSKWIGFNQNETQKNKMTSCLRVLKINWEDADELTEADCWVWKSWLQSFACGGCLCCCRELKDVVKLLTGSWRLILLPLSVQCDSPGKDWHVSRILLKSFKPFLSYAFACQFFDFFPCGGAYDAVGKQLQVEIASVLVHG